jgi:hypothetical protein
VDYEDYEQRVGYVRARLRLVATDAGGCAAGVMDDHRPNWGVGERLSGDAVLAGAPITVEAAARLEPGETGIVRLHPTHWDAWSEVRPGMRNAMHEGARIVGVAEVLKVVRHDRAQGAAGEPH